MIFLGTVGNSVSDQSDAGSSFLPGMASYIRFALFELWENTGSSDQLLSAFPNESADTEDLL